MAIFGNENSAQINQNEHDFEYIDEIDGVELVEDLTDTERRKSETLRLKDLYIHQIETLDLIGFRGDEFVSSLIIHLQNKSLEERRIKAKYEISHVGLAIRGKDLNRFTHTILKVFDNKLRNEDVYILESTASGPIVDKVRDVLGKYYFGVQLRPLKEVIEHYKGHAYWTKRQFHLTEMHYEKLSVFIRKYNYMPYETNMKIMFANFFPCIHVNTTDESVFCSELVARCLQFLGFLDEKVNPEKAVPMDFYENPNKPNVTLDIDEEIPVLYRHTLKLT